MSQRISVRIPNHVFISLREEAKVHGIKLSDVIRDKIIHANSRENVIPSVVKESKFEAFTNAGIESNQDTKSTIPHIEFAILETLYLLREFLFERNAQILKRVDDRLEKRFGTERKRF